jgi:hypothetical protein
VIVARWVLAGIVALLAACGSERPPKEASQAVEDGAVTGPRFLVVSFRRIQIIDRHPGAQEVYLRRDATPNGDSFDYHYKLAEYEGRPPDQRPEIHSYDLTLAVPEKVPTTFTRTLDEARGYRWMMTSRGWRTEDDGTVRLDAEETSNAQTRWGEGSGAGPNGSALVEITVPLGRWAAGGDVLHGREKDDQGRDYSYWELEEIRYGPITETPPADADRGVAETPGAQDQRRLEWPHAENVMKVP